jgi:hypothetical protein
MLVTGLLTLQTKFVGAGSIGGIIHVPADSPTSCNSKRLEAEE